MSSQVSNASLPRRKDSNRHPPAPPGQEDGYESVILPAQHSTVSEFIAQQSRPQDSFGTSSTQGPNITGSSPGTTPPVRPARRRSPAAKPYETVEIIPRKFGDQETVSELGEHTAGDPWPSHAPVKPGSFKAAGNDQGQSVYQKPPVEPVTVITAVNESYDNVRLKNTPCTQTESHSESIVNSDLGTVRESAEFDITTQTLKHDETTTLDERIETTDGNLEIDSGGMGCPNIDRAMEERRQLLVETETREGVVLLSVQKLRENSNDQTEPPHGMPASPLVRKHTHSPCTHSTHESPSPCILEFDIRRCYVSASVDVIVLSVHAIRSVLYIALFITRIL